MKNPKLRFRPGVLRVLEWQKPSKNLKVPPVLSTSLFGSDRVGVRVLVRLNQFVSLTHVFIGRYVESLLP